MKISKNTLSTQDFPNEDWIYNKNYTENGWSEPKLKEFKQFLIDSSPITGLVIVHKGQIVFDYGDIEENSYIASCRKSVLAMIYGKYVENKTINLDMSILIQFRNFLSRKDRKAQQKPISLRPLREIHFFYFQIGLLYVN